MRIQSPYVLIQGSTPIFVDRAGVRWLDRLWAIDAAEHTHVIDNLSVASPEVLIEAAGPNLVRIDADERLRQIAFVPLPHATSRLSALMKLPRTILALWAVVGNASIVHIGITGWPYPLGWLALPIARCRGKATVVVVESAPWRVPPGRVARGLAHIQAWVYEVLGRAVVRASDARFFTTQAYMKSLCGADAPRARVIEATWVPEDQLISEADFADAMRARADRVGGKPLRLAFFGRLASEKGVAFLMGAFQALPRLSEVASLDIYGEGPLDAELNRRIAGLSEKSEVHMKGVIEYGPSFFRRLRDYDYVVVPSLSDEQPRIVYDAYSQGIPVMASSTDGLRQCVLDGETGALFSPGSLDDFERCVLEAAGPSGEIRRERCAIAALDLAREKTHAAMHRNRIRYIMEFCGRGNDA